MTSRLEPVNKTGAVKLVVDNGIGRIIQIYPNHIVIRETNGNTIKAWVDDEDMADVLAYINFHHNNKD